MAPQGTICFILKGWKRRASDQFITENSNFVKYVQCGDVIMADRGFNIAETLGTFGAKLEISSFTKGQSQLHQRKLKKQEPLQMFEFMLNV